MWPHPLPLHRPLLSAADDTGDPAWNAGGVAWRPRLVDLGPRDPPRRQTHLVGKREDVGTIPGVGRWTSSVGSIEVINCLPPIPHQTKTEVRPYIGTKLLLIMRPHRKQRS